MLSRIVLLPLLSGVSLLGLTEESISANLATGFLPQSVPGRFWAMASSYRAGFDEDGIHLVRRGRRVDLRFPGARLRWKAEGHSGATLHFLHPHSGTLSGAASLWARQALPGVDIVVRIRDGRLKSEFHLTPGRSPSLAGYCVSGASLGARNQGQALEFDAGGGWTWREERLESWQDLPDGSHRPVASRFHLRGQCVGFATEAVDPSLPLVIDPELTFSTYLGGGMFDAITALAADPQGNTYLGGWTESSDFPFVGGMQPASGGRIDGFVAKVNASGQLVYSTYFGGTNEDRVQAIAVDASGVVTFAGLTNSTNIPVQIPARGALAGGRDAFLARLSAAGNQLVFSTYLGGTGHDAALAVAIDSSGNAVVAGETASTDFPAHNAYLSSLGGSVDGFLTRFSSTGALLSSTYFGGGGDDRIRAVAISSDGAIHATGSTASSNFPVNAAAFPSLHGSMDAFYTRFNAAASAIVLSTFLGGSGGSGLNVEAGNGIAIDSSGRTWIAGTTPSTDFPGVSSGHQSSYGGGQSDAFVAVFSPVGSLQWSTYIGGGGLDAANAISAGSGFIGVAGNTTSTNFPVSSPPQSSRAGEYDAFWAAFPLASPTPLYVSYLGGTGSDSALATAASGSTLALAGSTLSSDFPLQNLIQALNPGSYGGFLTRYRFGPGPATVMPASGAGIAQTFVFTISHATGSAAIQNAAFLFNSSFSFASGCYIYYDRSANLLSLYKDAGATWLPLAPGSASTVDNGVCSLSGTGLSTTSNTNSITVTIPVTFAGSFAGSKLVFANANDSVGLGAGWPQVGTWTVASPAAPTVGALTPSSGSGLIQTFSATFTDANGASDIAVASVLFNSTLAAANSCFFEWRRAANALFLFRDSDSGYTSIPLGSTSITENTNCTISASGAFVVSTGNQLTLTVPVIFKPSFAGPRTAYAAVIDGSGLSSGWQTAGSWTPAPTYTPAVATFSPTSGSGGSQTFTLAVTDGNGAADISTVEFLLNAGLATSGGCYLRYDRSADTLSLFRDSGALWLTLTPGSASSVTNGNCTIMGTGVTTAVSGNSVLLSTVIVFQPAFAGSKSIYVKANDSTGLSSGWISAGTWNVTPAVAPSVTSLEPASSTTITQSFTVTVSDANGNADIASLFFLVSTALNGANGCFVTFNRSLNLFYLFRDSDASWLSVTPGAPTTISNDYCTLAGTGLGVTAAANSLTFTIPLTAKASFLGPRSVFLSVADAGGLTSGWATHGTWAPSSAAAPAVTSVSPSSGSGAQQNFTLVLSDANGHTDISSAVVIINNVLSGGNACYISFNRSTSTYYLRRDSDLTWQPLLAGSTGSVTNDNCTLSGTGATISGSGNTLTLILPLSFKPAFSGARNFYAMVNDAGGLSSGWVTAGTWNPFGTPSPPTVKSLSPNAGSGTAQTFSVVLSDENGFADINSAVFLINGAIDGNNACYISFHRPSGTFHLFRDSDSSWQSITAGAAATVSNNNCSLAGAGLTVSGSANSLSIALPLTFKPAFTGLRNFYILAADASGLSSGWVSAGNWSPSGSPAPPAVTSLSPNNGSGTSQTFTIVLSDPNGFTDISSAVFLLNGGIDGNNACYLSFGRAANTFHLFRDSDAAWLSITPGTATSVSNSNCALSGSGLTVNSSGTSLTVSLPLTFTPAFAGQKNFYILVADSTSLSSGWVTAGSWNPSAATPAAPVLTSLTPNSGIGASQTFTAVLTDTNGFPDIANTVFLINGAIDGNNACYISFNRPANLFYLFRDSDQSWQSIAPGAPTSVTNNQCTLAGTGLAANGSGNSLTVTLPLSFKPAFPGTRNFYVLVADITNRSSGWITAGTWNGS